MIIKEIKSYNGNKNIAIEEEENQITIKFPIASATFGTISFIFKLKQKTDKEKIEEYEKFLKIIKMK